jgi:predicted lipoprotein with Yx(FWY)xxD motif
MRKALTLLLPLLALTGCGGSAAAGQPAAAKHAIVKTRHGALGTYLVDGSGRTLYRFMKDSGRHSRCSGACAQDWPPLTTKERPEAEGGAKASRLSTTRRSGGARQVLYAGHPLYRFASDSAPGDTGGQGLKAFGARWYVVAPSGRVIRGSGTPAPSSPYGY